MSSDTPKWGEVAQKLRQALGLCPPTPVEADDAIANAGEAPMDDGEVNDIVSDVLKGNQQNAVFHPDHSWTGDIDTMAVAEDSRFVMNRNPGEDDAEVDKTVEELRREALDDDEKPEDQA